MMATFKGTATEVDAINMAQVFSPDEQAVTLSFANLFVESNSDALVNTRTVSIEIPINRQEEDVCLRQQIRGYVDVDSSAQAVLVVHAAGETTVVNIKDDGNGTRSKKSKYASRRPVSTAGASSRDFDFSQVINSKLPAGDSYRVTMFLLVERNSEDSFGLLSITSLDIEIAQS